MYAKLFGTVITSSLTQKEPIEVRGVFFMLLAIADKDGNVPGSEASIARVINVPIAIFRRAIVALSAPDLESNSKAEDGRRIVGLGEQPGFKIVTYEKWSGIRTDEERRAYYAVKKRESRERIAAKVKEQYHHDSRTALHWLNQESGRNFRELNSSLAPISARLEEKGVTLDGVKAMISRQCRKWKGTSLAEYLQPSTLFGKQKFDNYYTAKDQPINENINPIVNPRNVGIVIGPTDYATARPRGQVEREAREREAKERAEKELADEMAADANHPPAT